MDKKEAIEILQEHIETYNYQLSRSGWIQMVQAGIASPTVKGRIDFEADAARQIEAYKMAIGALKENDAKVG